MLGKLMVLMTAAAVALASPAVAIPQTDPGGQAVSIPFDPPLGEPLRYRWEKSVQKDGETKLNWSVDDFTFEEHAEGYRLSVTPVSSGSNETDPKSIAFRKLLDELSRLPFVVRINTNAEIVELERGDELWAKLTDALRSTFADEKLDPTQKKAVEGIVTLLDEMPPKSRLAKMTEPLQPLVEFAGLEFTLGKAAAAETESPSPFGGTLKREHIISVTKVDDSFAYATIRSTIPSVELERLTKGFLERMGVDLAKGKSAAEREAAMAIFKQLKMETVASYKISLENGLLDSFQSTETLSIPDQGKSAGRVTTTSLTRVY